MNLFQRAFRYLSRKKRKMFILFFIFLVADIMILSNISILRAVKEKETHIKEQTGSKVLLVSNDKNLISDSECEKIECLEDVIFINRQAENLVFPIDFSFITKSNDKSKENQALFIYGTDDSEKDGIIAGDSHYLKEGEHIKPNKSGILINKVLADVNQVNIGDSLTLKSENGDVETARVIGMYSMGREEKQIGKTLAIHRMENQIYMDMKTYGKLFKNTECRSLYVYTDNPESLETLSENIEDILGKKVSYSTSDKLYRRMKAPLMQIERSTNLMLMFTAMAVVIVVTLLQCMWMRSRKYETAIFISLGIGKWNLYLQTFSEVLLIFILSLFATIPLGNFITQEVAKLFTEVDGQEILIGLTVGTDDLMQLLIIGTLFISVIVVISLLPMFRTNPKNILSESEG